MTRLLRIFTVFSVFVLTCFAAVAHAEQEQKDVAKRTGKILILSPYFVDPARDTVGYNDMVEKLTQAFSAELQPRLQVLGWTPVNVMDKTTRYGAGEKLAIHGIKAGADSAIVLGLQSREEKGKFFIDMNVQYFDLKVEMKDGRAVGVAPVNPFERSYYITGDAGLTELTPANLADAFMADLKSFLAL